MRVLMVIPTYEPYYVHHLQLEQFYTDNFDSFLNPKGNPDFKLILTDFASSKSYKAFLRNYVSKRPGCYLIDGQQEASRYIAFNIALRNFEYDYVSHGALDLRARDGDWLEILLKDFDDPKVQIVTPTVNGDGNKSCDQDQVGPIERDSRPLRLHEQFNVHGTVLSHRFLKHFDNRYPDILDWHFLEDFLMYQLAALGYIAKVNFRVNLAHGAEEVLPLKPGNELAGWGKRNDLDEADGQSLLRRSSHLLNYLDTAGLSLTRKFRIHLDAMKTQRWRYFYFRLFALRAFEDFARLDLPTKVTVMRALFYRPLSDYETFFYSIYAMDSVNAISSEFRASRASIGS